PENSGKLVLPKVTINPAANAYRFSSAWEVGFISCIGDHLEREENLMQFTRFALFVALIAAVSWCRQATAQNLLTDPSFENPALYAADGPPFVGSWEAFNGGAGSSSQNDTLAPRTGAREAHLNITATNNTFAGFFQ